MQRLAELKTPGLARAFERVPREEFVGPGPWRILRPAAEQGFVDTPDDDPIHLYDTVMVALDVGRRLNNGEPVSVAQWLDLLRVEPGESFAHIGCGVGYYSAVIGETTGPGAYGLALEVDPEVARVATDNLAPYSDLEVRCAAEIAEGDGPFDVIFVNAGATRVPPSWLKALNEGGRLLLPLTVGFSGSLVGAGRVVRIVRTGDRFDASFVSFAAIGHCDGARTDDGNEALRVSYADGDADLVHSVRLDAHDSTPECWLHADDFCLSYRENSG